MAFCYINGEILEEEKARIPVHTLGIQRGFGVFDFFRSRDGRIAFIEDYLDRFENSQRFLDLNRMMDKGEVKRVIAELQKKNNFASSAFKLMLLGDGKDSDERLSPFFYVTNISMSDIHEQGAGRLILHEYLREYPEVKSINYLTSYHLHKRKKEAGAVDVLYHSNGRVSETSRSNIFIIKNGILKTPGQNILHGISRKHILKMGGHDIEIQVGDLGIDEVLQADEVFITSTLKEIMPIVWIDEHEISGGQPGPVTLKLQKLFQDYVMEATRLSDI